jgi:4-amino-4-deoxy-L-arabinose transferase-like glycosyltransferase
MGTITVLLTMYIARRWFDPITGIVSACVLATTYEFWSYATLAEDDVYLAALVAGAIACFTTAQTRAQPQEADSPVAQKLRGLVRQLVSSRHVSVLGYFALLGLGNVARGPMLAIIYGGCPVAVFALAQAITGGKWTTLSRYTWLYGWIVLLLLALAWPLYAWHVHPDVLPNWKYDYVGRLSGTYAAINEPWWAYPVKILPLSLAPWTPLCIVGLVTVWRRRLPGDQWILCWALVPLLILSIPQGKHHHYVVPFVAPWAILGALGLVRVHRWIEERTTFPLAASETPIMTGVMLLALGIYSFGESKLAAPRDHTLDDTAFLIRARAEAPVSIPLFIDAKLGPPGNLDFFRVQFYSRPDARLVHNLSFLRDQKITAAVVFVICRSNDRAMLDQLGATELIDQSKKSHEQDLVFGPLSLYRLTFRPDLTRYPAPDQITSLQAMERAPGPCCGPPLR